MTLAITSLLTFVAGVLIGHMVGSGDRLVREQEIYDLRHRLFLAGADPETSGSQVRRRGRRRCHGPRRTA